MDVIIGIDPGSVSGWAVLDVGPSPTPIMKGVFSFKKPPNHQVSSPSALALWILEELESRGATVVKVVIEDQYLDKNPDTLKKLSRNAGRWEEAFTAAGVPVEYIAASTWQSKELGLTRAKRDVLRRAADSKAYGLWKLEGPEHLIDATLITRCEAVTMFYRTGPKVSKAV